MNTSTSQLPNGLPNRDIQQQPPAPATVAEPGLILSESRQVLLGQQQRLALEWLLNEEGATIKDAAEYAGVTRATVSRWVNHDPDFRALYQAWQQQQQQMNESEMVGLEASALAVLRDAIRDRRDQRAAEFIIKQATARRRNQRPPTCGEETLPPDESK